MGQYRRFLYTAIVTAGVIALLTIGSSGVRVHPNPPCLFEKMMITDEGYYRVTDKPSGWVIRLWFKNSGVSTASIIHLYINGSELIPESNYGANGIKAGEIHTSIPDYKTGKIIKGGEMGIISIYISDENIEDGSKIIYDIRLHSKNGNDYFSQMTLYKSGKLEAWNN